MFSLSPLPHGPTSLVVDVAGKYGFSCYSLHFLFPLQGSSFPIDIPSETNPLPMSRVKNCCEIWIHLCIPHHVNRDCNSQALQLECHAYGNSTENGECGECNSAEPGSVRWLDLLTLCWYKLWDRPKHLALFLFRQNALI